MIKDRLIDLLFPKMCIGCEEEGSFFCDACFSKIPKKREHECPFCRNRTPFGETCLSCARRHSLDGVFAATPFRENRIIESAIHVMKYEFVSELGAPLGQLLLDAVLRAELPLPDIVVPVPLHSWRFRFRGFNQTSLIAEELTRHLAPELAIPMRTNLLRRVRFTLPQARSHDAKERKENLRDAFALEDGVSAESVRHAIVWLIDDVATTGATLEECAKILKKAGAKKVLGIVVAR